MSLDITIKQKGLFKRKLTLTDILMGKFQYGRYDENYVLVPQERSETEMTLFHPQRIARGISVIWNEKEVSQIVLNMLFSTTNEEIDDLYELVIHLCQLWKTNVFTQDGQDYHLSDIEALKEKMKVFNYDTLCSFINEHEHGNFFCTMWPYSFVSSEKKHWIEDKTLQTYAKELHQNQSIDLYYANARYYQDGDKQIFGVYTVTSTVDTIFPFQPLIPFSQMNLRTGDSIEAQYYRVALVSLEQEAMIGDIGFDEFIKEISKKELHEFDSEHFYFEGLTEQEVNHLVEQYSSKLL